MLNSELEMPWVEFFDPDDVQACCSKVNFRAALTERASTKKLCNHAGHAITFVLCDDAPQATPYETWVAQTGRIPTRDNDHDRLNALIWLSFPKIKSRINYLHAAQIEGDGVSERRGPLRDALTIFDESGGLFLYQQDDVLADLCEFRWGPLLMGRRDQYGRRFVFVPFGHALLEKLLRPYKGITAQVLPVQVDALLPYSKGLALVLDEWVALSMTPQLSASLLTPLPVMGLPGWDPLNEDESFYRDASVFRPPRVKRVKKYAGR